MWRELNALPIWIGHTARKLRIRDTEVGVVSNPLEQVCWLALLALVKRVSAVWRYSKSLSNMPQLLKPGAEADIIRPKVSKIWNKPAANLKSQASMNVLIQSE